MSTLKLTITAFCVGFVGLLGSLVAQEEQNYTEKYPPIVGLIESVDIKNNKVTVVLKDKKKQELSFVEDSFIILSNEESKLSDLQKGFRATVSFMQDNGAVDTLVAAKPGEIEFETAEQDLEASSNAGESSEAAPAETSDDSVIQNY